MGKFYTLYEQTLDVSGEIKEKEVEAFIMKYHLDFKSSTKRPESKPIWQFFVIFIIINTIIGIGYAFTSGLKMNELLYGYGLIIVLYILTYFMAKFKDHNIKVN